MKRFKFSILLFAAVLAALFLVGCASGPAGQPPPPAIPSATPVAPGGVRPGAVAADLDKAQKAAIDHECSIPYAQRLAVWQIAISAAQAAIKSPVPLSGLPLLIACPPGTPGAAPPA